MDPAQRPVATSFFPWARTGLGAGLSFAVGIACLDIALRPARAPAAPIAREAATPGTLPPKSAPDAIDVPAARSVSAFAPIAVPWPAGARTSTTTSNGSEGMVNAGDSTLTRDDADSFYERALAPCAPTRTLMGKAVTWTCESAREESRAHIVPRSTSLGTWLRASQLTFAPPRVHTPSTSMPTSAASCGWTMRFVALPEGAHVIGSGGSDHEGQCTFDIEIRPVRAWSTMLKNIFRPGTSVMKRAVDDGTVTRWTAEAWDHDAWWRLDVVSAAGDAQRARVYVQRWAPDSAPWAPPIAFAEKGKALEGCWEPCALALRGASDATDEELVRRIDRCLYECKGTEQAPAHTEP